MSLKGHRHDDFGGWWSGWKNHHWPADALRRGFQFYAYDKETRRLFALVEVTKGSSFTYRTLGEYERKVQRVAGFWPNRDDPHWKRLPLPASGKHCTGYAFRWRRVDTVNLRWRGRFPRLGWAHIPSSIGSPSDVSTASGDEGDRKWRTHLAAERKPWLRALAKDYWRTKLGRLTCLVCGFDFERRYGALGAEFIEMHHIKPMASRRKGRRTPLVELTPLCANCHRMVHYKRRVPLALEVLRRSLRLTVARTPTRARAARAGGAKR
jgi:HNH endonuclease